MTRLSSAFARPVTIAAISTDLLGPIGEAFGQQDNVRLAWMTPQMVGEVEACNPNVLIIDGGIGQSCEPLIRSARNWASPPAIITLGDVPMNDFRALIGYPKADAVAGTISASDLRDLTAKVLQANQPSVESGKSGECWVLTGAVGGAGASLIAIETAYLLLQKCKKSNQTVALIDLNFEDGSLATYLDISPGLDVAALCSDPERIDAALLSAFVSEHQSGLHLIAAPRGARFGHTIAPEAVLRLLEIVCDGYDYVVVDLPRWRESWTAPIVKGADQLVIVSELTVPALHAARHLAEDFEKLSQNVASPAIILNRMAKRMFGHSVSVGQAEGAIQRKSLASISSDWDAAAAAVNMGMPVSMARPGSRLSKDVEELVDLLTQADAQASKAKVA